MTPADAGWDGACGLGGCSAGSNPLCRRHQRKAERLLDLLKLIHIHRLQDGPVNQVLRRIRMIPGVTNSDTSLLLATPRSVKARL